MMARLALAPILLLVVVLVAAGGARAEEPISDPDLMHYLLWTPENPEEFQELLYGDASSMAASNFDPTRPTKLLFHGYTSNGLSSWIPEARDAFFSIGDFNVISVDYEKLGGPAPYYIQCAENSYLVGERAADFIRFLVDNFGGSIDDYHPIGWSLGGQVVGLLGHYMDGQLPRVTALDPAGPFYHTQPQDKKLSKGSAQFVDVIHTAGMWLGMDEPSGTVDFYPNSGQAPQPGCEGEDIGLGCSHRRGPDYFIESINSDVGFASVKCTSWTDFEAGLCQGEEENLMGYPTNTGAEGFFYLRTTDAKPFAIAP